MAKKKTSQYRVRASPDQKSDRLTGDAKKSKINRTCAIILLGEMKSLWQWAIDNDVELAALGQKVDKVCDILTEMVNEKASLKESQARRTQNGIFKLACSYDLSILDDPVASTTVALPLATYINTCKK